MLARFKLVIFVGVIFLVGCNSSQEERGSGDPNIFQNLSTDNQEERIEQPESPLNEIIENQDPTGQVETNIESVEQNKEDQQQTLIPEPVSPNIISESNEVEREEFDVHEELPFANFKERWNAVTDANFSNLYIKRFHEATNDVGVTHTAALNESMELRVHTSGDFVQSIELVSRGNVNVATMLTGWSQVINILHPQLEIHDVDGFFNDLGIGPNGDLSDLKMGTFPYYHMIYTISKNENGYVFTGSYS